jgi:hypothetical protein
MAAGTQGTWFGRKWTGLPWYAAQLSSKTFHSSPPSSTICLCFPKGRESHSSCQVRPGAGLDGPAWMCYPSLQMFPFSFGSCSIAQQLQSSLSLSCTSLLPGPSNTANSLLGLLMTCFFLCPQTFLPDLSVVSDFLLSRSLLKCPWHGLSSLFPDTSLWFSQSSKWACLFVWLWLAAFSTRIHFGGCSPNAQNPMKS